MSTEITYAYNAPQEIRTLFAEYTDMLIQHSPAFSQYLKLQNYDEEVQNLEIKYGLPDGRLYLAQCNGAAAGCIGLRRIDEKNCEMKRLYVKPAFRGKKIGQVLVRKIIADAQDIGYCHMLLDTFPFLQSAIKMYQSFGFYEIPSYNNTPMDTLVYMQLDL